MHVVELRKVLGDYVTCRRSTVRPERSEMPVITGFGLGNGAPHHVERYPSHPLLSSPQAQRPAVVTIDGRDVYLGNWNTAASRREYKRVIAQWTAIGRYAARGRQTT